MSLAVEARPVALDSVVGNKLVRDSLQSLLDANDLQTIPHSYLFYGPAGCGKTTLARIMAQGYGCSETDIVEINAADLRGIDMVRDQIVRPLSFKPLGGVIAFILDEAHQLSKDAMNCLLKPLEDCPVFCYFFLCTTEPSQIIKTVRTRCAEYEVTPLDEDELKILLIRAGTKYNINVPDVVIEEIAECSDGCPRTALTILDQVKGIGTVEAVREFAAELSGRDTETLALCRIVVGKRSFEEKVGELFERYKELKNKDSEKLRRAMLGYLRSCLLNFKTVSDANRFSQMVDQLTKVDVWKGGPASFVSCLFKLCAL